MHECFLDTKFYFSLRRKAHHDEQHKTKRARWLNYSDGLGTWNPKFFSKFVSYLDGNDLLFWKIRSSNIESKILKCPIRFRVPNTSSLDLTVGHFTFLTRLLIKKMTPLHFSKSRSRQIFEMFWGRSKTDCTFYKDMQEIESPDIPSLLWINFDQIFFSSKCIFFCSIMVKWKFCRI